MITDVSNMKLKTRSMLGIQDRTLNMGNNTVTFKTDMHRLERYRQYWEAMSDIRTRTRRNTDYARGRQLENLVTNDAGETVTEREYISAQGKTPFVQNLISPVLKSIEGVFRQDNGQTVVVSRRQDSSDVEKMLTDALQAVLQTNMSKEVDAATLRYFLLSGIPVQRLGYDYCPEHEKYDVVIDYYDPNYLFVNNDIADIRGKDLNLIGLIHNLSLDDMYLHFCNSPQDREAIKSIYRVDAMNEMPNYDSFSRARVQNLDFYMPIEPHKFRVIETWEKKAIEVIEVHDEIDGSKVIWKESLEKLHEVANQRYEMYRANGVPEVEIPRIHYKYITTTSFFYTFMSPYGHILKEGKSPYRGGMHPFTVMPYPLLSGEIWGPVEELLDTADQYNRLFTMWDFLIGTSAKNTLIVDEASLNGLSVEEISEDYRRVGGVIVLKLKDGAKPPFEIKGQIPNLGLFEMMQSYLQQVQRISGVHPALQGQQPNSGTPNARYVAETQNSIINLTPVLEFIGNFRKERDRKALKMIMQFYKEPRFLPVTGNTSGGSTLYDPQKIAGFEADIDLVMAQNNNSPVYKAMNDEILKEFAIGGLISMEHFLKNTDYSFSKKLLEDITNTKEQIAAQQGAMQRQGQPKQPM